MNVKSHQRRCLPASTWMRIGGGGVLSADLLINRWRFRRQKSRFRTTNALLFASPGIYKPDYQKVILQQFSNSQNFTALVQLVPLQLEILRFEIFRSNHGQITGTYFRSRMHSCAAIGRIGGGRL